MNSKHIKGLLSANHIYKLEHAKVDPTWTASRQEVQVNIQISNASSDPIYLQIKQQIKAAILSGQLQAGTQLPSIRFLAKELRVSVITTKRAYDELELEGFLDSVQGKGSFVAAQNPELMREEQLKKVEAYLTQALQEAYLAGLSVTELQEMLEILAGDTPEVGTH